MKWWPWGREEPPAHEFTFDGTPETGADVCGKCEEPNEWSRGFILDHGKPFAVFFVWWHPHAHAAWMDVILGSIDGTDFTDNVTFASRHGWVEGSLEPAATLIDAKHEGSIAGRCLTREEALEHPRLADNWAVTDWLYWNDELVHRGLVHLGPNPDYRASEA